LNSFKLLEQHKFAYYDKDKAVQGQGQSQAF